MKRPKEKRKEPNEATERTGYKDRKRNAGNLTKCRAERNQIQRQEKECRESNELQRRKKPDTEIGKGIQRFEPNAEKKEPDTET